MRYHRKIRCPGHFVIIPGKEPYLMEPVPALKNVSSWVFKDFGVKKYRARRDANGMRIRDRRSYYQPEISANYAIHHVYDPQGNLCKQCDKRCLEGFKSEQNSIMATIGKRIPVGGAM